eukprot:5093890-Prorocentrum_lima.AAC.1
MMLKKKKKMLKRATATRNRRSRALWWLDLSPSPDWRLLRRWRKGSRDGSPIMSPGASGRWGSLRRRWEDSCAPI